MTYTDFEQAAKDAISLEMGARIEMDDDRYLSVYICSESGEDECVIMNYCYSDSTIIWGDQSPFSRLDAAAIETFYNEAIRF